MTKVYDFLRERERKYDASNKHDIHVAVQKNSITIYVIGY